MTKDAKTPGEYVREVTESTLSYVQDLQREVAELRAVVATLEARRSELEAEIARLVSQHGPDPEMARQYAQIERQNANLANLYVASYRLHDTLDRSEALAVIQEILANLVGSEEIGVFELAGDGTLGLLSQLGLDASRYRSIPASGGLIGRAVASGEVLIATEADAAFALPHEAGLSACVPLKLEGRVTGVIAVFRLLSHKPALTRVDEEMFELLATHAAMSLYCTGLHARAASLGLADRAIN